MFAANKEATEPRVPIGYPSLRKFYGHHHDLVDRYRISVSQMTTDMFHLTQTLPGPFFIYNLPPGLKLD